MSTMFTQDKRIARGTPAMFKTDSHNNNYSLQDNGEIWLWISKPQYATNTGDIVGDALVIYRASMHWDKTRKGWGLAIPLLKWRKSFPFTKIVVKTATTPKGRSFTGQLSRRLMLERADDVDETRIYEHCLKEVIFHPSDLKRKD